MKVNWLIAYQIFLIAQFSSISIARSSVDFHEFEQKIVTLFRLVQFMVERPEQMNVDGLFGITLAEANLLATFRHPNVQFLAPRHRLIVSKILRLLYEARVKMKKTVRPETSDVAYINEVLNEPSLWIKPIFWQNGTLGCRLKPTVGLNSSMVANLLYNGSPQEEESDSCLRELSMSGQSRICQVSKNCTEMLVRADYPAGYPLTHRLLYVQVARALGIKCWRNQNSTFVKLTAAYCHEVLQNLVDAESLDFPGVSRDLAIEQVLFCGMEGFMEFASDHYAKLFRTWAHPSGCYESTGFAESQKNLTYSSLRRAKRSSGKMDFGCDNHTSGLAAASFALFVRENVENALSNRLDRDCEKIFFVDLPSVKLVNVSR